MKLNWNSHKSIGNSTFSSKIKDYCIDLLFSQITMLLKALVAFVFGHQTFNWTWSPWTKSKWTFINIALRWKCLISKGWMTLQIHSSDFSSFSCWSTTEKNRNSYLFSKLCLKFGVDFWCFQLTFDVFNWVYSKHMIHYNKVNWKNFAKNFLKIFPIDFQSPIDFSQLHMIRPYVCMYKYIYIYIILCLCIFWWANFITLQGSRTFAPNT